MAILVTNAFEKFLEKAANFKSSNDFFCAHDYTSNLLEIFMQSDCLQIALIHNKTQKIKEHLLKLDEKAFFSEEVIQNLIAIVRPLVLTSKEFREKLYQYYRKLTEQEKFDLILRLNMLIKEKRNHARCPIILHLRTLGLTNVQIEKEEAENTKKIEELTAKHQKHKKICEEIINEINSLLGI